MPRADANTQWFDRYSLVHAALGATFEVSRIPDSWAIGSQVAFEAVENRIKDAFSDMWPDSRHDAIQNHIGDVASFVAGYYGARALRSSVAGVALITGFVGASAALWIWQLANAHSWEREA
jgi:hypothetical protein